MLPLSSGALKRSVEPPAGPSEKIGTACSLSPLPPSNAGWPFRLAPIETVQSPDGESHAGKELADCAAARAADTNTKTAAATPLKTRRISPIAPSPNTPQAGAAEIRRFRFPDDVLQTPECCLL